METHLPDLLAAATKLVSHLIEKLPGSVGEKSPPADVLINIMAVTQQPRGSQSRGCPGPALADGGSCAGLHQERKRDRVRAQTPVPTLPPPGPASWLCLSPR